MRGSSGSTYHRKLGLTIGFYLPETFAASYYGFDRRSLVWVDDDPESKIIQSC